MTKYLTIGLTEKAFNLLSSKALSMNLSLEDCATAIVEEKFESKPDEIEASSKLRIKRQGEYVELSLDDINPSELESQEALQQYASTKYLAHVKKEMSDRAAEEEWRAAILKEKEDFRVIPRPSAAEIIAQMQKAGFTGR